MVIRSAREELLPDRFSSRLDSVGVMRKSGKDKRRRRGEDSLDWVGDMIESAKGGSAWTSR